MQLPQPQPGEEIRWRGHPRVRLSIPECLVYWALALGWCFFVNPAHLWWAWVLALPLIAAPWISRTRDCRTTYYNVC